MEILEKVLVKNDFVVAFLIVGLGIWVSTVVARKLPLSVPGVAIAIGAALVLAYFGGKKGLAEFPMLGGLALLGGSMLRDFSIVATAMGANFDELRKTGLAGVISLLAGVIITFTLGAIIAVVMGFSDPVDITTIAAGACTYIVGPVTGAAIGASSEVIAISIATGVVKTIFVTIITPLTAKRTGLDNPASAMVFGGLIGTTSGVAAGLAATDPRLVPYGAMTATFYTGLGVLLCPSLLYWLVMIVL